jgi:hypothetical protein
MGRGDAKLVTAPNGAVINDEALRAIDQLTYTKPTTEKIADGIWVIGGYSIVNCTVIEAPGGLIVYDTGDNAEEGKHFREVIEREISKTPIKAIIYSHSHYALGGGAMVDDPKSVMVIGHPKLNETVNTNLQGGGAPSAIPELGPALTARAIVQFNNFLPREGGDTALAAAIQIKEPAFLPVTQPVDDGQTLDVAGLQLQFFTKYISDDYSVTVWIPSRRTVLNNFFWPGTPNLYSLRGGVYRDPQVWRDGLKVIRDLQPEVLLNTHTRPIVGKDKVFEALTNYMDLVTLTYDQTLRGILHGLGPDELRYFIYKPKHLADAADNAEIYGETPWYPPAIYYYQMRGLTRKASPRQDLLRINEAILEVIALTRAEAVKNGVWVKTQLAEGLPLIQGDRVQLQQVILNLIINAFEAMAGAGEGPRELLISSGKAEGDACGVLVAVRDSGPGLAPANIEHLFEAFYTTKLVGLGMGLSICRSIVEVHNGRVWATPNVPRGAVFQFTVPANPDTAP